jgi:L-aspartate oxidase
MSHFHDHERAPVVVIGAGLGGLVTALELAPEPVILLNRALLGRDTASAWAQGGIAAALDPADTPAAHAADTLAAGDGLCDAAVVAAVTDAAPGCIALLERHGVRFDRDAGGRYALGREGGHHARRIAHVRDATGDAITRAMIAAARATPSITLLEGIEAEDLLTDGGRVVGVYAHRGAERLLFSARAVVLATGGVGGLYRYTSNPLGARGDGLALAARAGARLRDLEFVQFHPTAIDIGSDPMPLATEALRGEGSVLVDETGRRFMQGVHELADLAPRDVVARSIWAERARGHQVYLDATRALGAQFAERFPTVFAACRRAGIDPAAQPIPVAPAAHYHMGGIEVDADGRSTVPGLWAVGEVACTGLHGANRLASNSLLEAAVYGARAARDIQSTDLPIQRLKAPPRSLRPVDEAQSLRQLTAIRARMQDDVGLLRSAGPLRAAIAEFHALCAGPAPLARSVENAATVALMIAVAALGREESRGGHWRTDFPQPASEARHSTLDLATALDVAGGSGVAPLPQRRAG